jgi:hypothetical protein
MLLEIESTTVFITKSPVSSILDRVSFSLSLVCRFIDTTTVGGTEQTALKNENGAKFRTPELEMLETNAIGRGTTTPVRIE